MLSEINLFMSFPERERQEPARDVQNWTGVRRAPLCFQMTLPTPMVAVWGSATPFNPMAKKKTPKSPLGLVGPMSARWLARDSDQISQLGFLGIFYCKPSGSSFWVCQTTL
jgi:hypothetical protein